tara:strand:+ start:184 stop:843 length:660 start_codon:yes stop_codon:yes gene_type:complete
VKMLELLKAREEQMNEIQKLKSAKLPFILLDEKLPCHIQLAFNLCEGKDVILTTFAEDKRTRDRLKKDVIYVADSERYHIKQGTALFNLANILLENHLDSHNDEGNYVSDMDTIINIQKCDIWDIDADEFYLENSVTYMTSHWTIVNEQGQRVALHHKDLVDKFFGYELTWSRHNITDEDGKSDYFSHKYDFNDLVDSPIESQWGKGSDVFIVGKGKDY